MRCPDCNKFVGNEEQEPEVELEIDDEGHVTIQARIVNACDQCGTELTEAQLEMEDDVDIDEHKKDCAECTLEIEETSSEREQRHEGKGRSTRTFYGAAVEYDVACAVCEVNIASKRISDFVQASHMEPLL